MILFSNNYVMKKVRKKNLISNIKLNFKQKKYNFLLFVKI